MSDRKEIKTPWGIKLAMTASKKKKVPYIYPSNPIANTINYAAMWFAHDWDHDDDKYEDTKKQLANSVYFCATLVTDPFVRDELLYGAHAHMHDGEDSWWQKALKATVGKVLEKGGKALGGIFGFDDEGAWVGKKIAGYALPGGSDSQKDRKKAAKEGRDRTKLVDPADRKRYQAIAFQALEVYTLNTIDGGKRRWCLWYYTKAGADYRIKDLPAGFLDAEKAPEEKKQNQSEPKSIPKQKEKTPQNEKTPQKQKTGPVDNDKPEAAGLSTGAMVAIGLSAAAIIGGAFYYFRQ